MPYSPYIDILLVRLHICAQYKINQTIKILHGDIAFKIM